MVPRDAKRANGADLEARLARDADPSSVLPLDVRGLVRPLGEWNVLRTEQSVR